MIFQIWVWFIWSSTKVTQNSNDHKHHEMPCSKRDHFLRCSSRGSVAHVGVLLPMARWKVLGRPSWVNGEPVRWTFRMTNDIQWPIRDFQLEWSFRISKGQYVCSIPGISNVVGLDSWQIYGGGLYTLSEQQLLDCAGAEYGNDGCHGGNPMNAPLETYLLPRTWFLVLVFFLILIKMMKNVYVNLFAIKHHLLYHYHYS